jgi:trimethylamine--corrinoid protein Co-methyltransferase
MELHLFAREDLEAIHGATIEVMGTAGLRVFGDEAREVLHDSGCHIDKESGMVRFPQDLVEDCIRAAPSRVLLAARDPKHDVVVEGDSVFFTNFGTGISVDDPRSQGLRESTKEDLGNTALLCDALDEIDIYTLALAARDVPEESRVLHEAEAVLNNTAKHFAHDTDGAESTKRFVEMGAVIAGGMENLRERPIISTCTCPNSPLELHTVNTEIIIESARAGVPVNVLSMAMSGGTGPVTLAGTLVVQNAEVLGGIVLAQLTRKGAPVLYGSSTTMLDLLYSTSPVGSPEHGLISAAVAQIGHYYEIPTYVGGT